MLIVDSCHEKARRQLMRCYYQQGQIFWALRQYHQCIEALSSELDMSPTEETEQLLRLMQQNKPL
jgi:DNA-binding SARP family transcriptional activator